jgi:hypothetical protein
MVWVGRGAEVLVGCGLAAVAEVTVVGAGRVEEAITQAKLYYERAGVEERAAIEVGLEAANRGPGA